MFPLTNSPLKDAALICFAIFFGVLAFAQAIAEIVVGAVYLHDCPVQPLIPVYLVVVGVLYLLQPCLFTTGSLCVWFLFGNVWVYSIYEPNYDKTLDQYCDKTVYLFAFCTTTLNYILLALAFFCVCIHIILN